MPQFFTGSGRRVAPGPATPTATGIPVGADSAQALQQFGNAAADVGLHQMAQEKQERERQAQMTEMSLRQQDLLQLQRGNDALRDAHDEIANGVANGTIDKTQAEATWMERAKALSDENSAKLRSQHQDIARREMEGMALKLGNSVRRVVEKRNQSDIAAGIDQTLEYQARQYGVDPAKATQQMQATLEQLGPFAGLSPEQIQRKAQAWKEGTQYTQAYAAISAGRNDRKALDAAEKLVADMPDLDPQKRATLLDRAQAYRLHQDQQAEVAAQRRQREADAHLKRAEAAFNVYQTMADKGTLLDPAYTDQVLQQTAGTAYQQGVVALSRQAVETGGLAAQPIAVQQRELDQLNADIAKQGLTPALSKRRDQANKVLTGSQQDLEKDGLRAGLERGVIQDIAPIDFSRGLPGVVQQLQARIPQAQRVSAWAGRPVSVLTSDEVESMSNMMGSLAPKDKATMTAAIAQVIGPQSAQALSKQMAPKDNALSLAFGYAGAQTTQGRFVSELILRGQQAIKDGTSTKAAKQPDLQASRWKADLAADLADVYPSQQQANQVLEAAVLMTHATAAEQGGALSNADRERMVRMAVGGAVVELNGRKVPTPFEADGAESKLNRRLNSVTAQELAPQVPGGHVLAAGVPMPVDDFVKTLPGQQLVYAGPNRYAVLVGGRPVKNAAGRNILIEVH